VREPAGDQRAREQAVRTTDELERAQARADAPGCYALPR
jgi:hypothetical protein